MRRYLIFAAVLLVSELALGVGLIGAAEILVAVVVLLLPSREWPNLRRRLLVASAFICVALATLGWLAVNTRVAKRNAIPVIAACERFRVEHNRYPSDLNELVPALLPSLPRAR
jgi:hypothetical protein